MKVKGKENATPLAHPSLFIYLWSSLSFSSSSSSYFLVVPQDEFIDFLSLSGCSVCVWLARGTCPCCHLDTNRSISSFFFSLSLWLGGGGISRRGKTGRRHRVVSFASCCSNWRLVSTAQWPDSRSGSVIDYCTLAFSSLLEL